MNLIVREYVAQLRERNELDAILPYLLRQMGLTVITKPKIGTRQYGVDISAVGKYDSDQEAVYLLSVKAKNLNRNDWHDRPQGLRASCDEIIDYYIPKILSEKYSNYPINICLCFGDDIDEDILPMVNSYTSQAEERNPRIKFHQWNGDVLTNLIDQHLLGEKLLPLQHQSNFRKAIAMLNEPDVSLRYFQIVIHEILKNVNNKKNLILAIKQINTCLWILFSWSRDAENLESPYLASEYCLLQVWNACKDYLPKRDGTKNSIVEIWTMLLNTHLYISENYFFKLSAYSTVPFGLSRLVSSASEVSVNLKLFDMLGRFAMFGIWMQYHYSCIPQAETEKISAISEKIKFVENTIKSTLVNNTILFSPYKDNQFVEIYLVVIFLGMNEANSGDVINWLSIMLDRVKFSLSQNCYYPSTETRYEDIVNTCKLHDEEHKKAVTKSSFLYATIALIACYLNADELLQKIQDLKADYIPYCALQLWFPDSKSEDNIYVNSEVHGKALLIKNLAKKDILQEVGDTLKMPEFSRDKLSILTCGLWPIELLASRHYRIPISPVYIHDILGSGIE